MKTITGNTYAVRDQIKALGGKWNPAAKGWDVDDEVAEKVAAIVAASPAMAPRGAVYRRPSYGRYGQRSSYARFSGGAESFRNSKGRCEDAPCCGCCS